MYKLYLILSFLVFYFITETRSFTDYTLESIKVINETSRSPGFTNMTLKRVNRGYPKIFGNIELIDSLKDYDGEAKVFYSSAGNNQYILLPFKIYRKPICNILNTEYRNRAMHDLQKYSNFPFSEDPKVDLCDLMPPGQYYWRNYSADLSMIPRTISPGRYRVQVLIYKKSETISCKGFEFLSLFT